MNRKKFNTLVIHFLYFCGIQLCLVFFYFLIAGHWLTVRDKVTKADAVWVLGGDSCDFHRTAHGVDLVKLGIADTVIFTGSGLNLQDVLQAASSFGLHLSQSVSFDSCLSTIDEAKAVRAFVEKHKISSIVFVTDIYHSRRAKKTFRKFLRGVKIYSSPAYNSNYHDKYWWKTETGFVAVYIESFKLVYYLFRYGVFPV